MTMAYGIKPGLFGRGSVLRPEYGTPGIGDGHNQVSQQPEMPVMAAPSQMPQPKSPWQAIAGTIGDTLLQYNGMDAIYAPQQAAQSERETKFADWRRQYDYERANPSASAAQPYRFEDNAGNVYERDAATGQNRLIFTDPNDKQFIQDGQLVTVPNVVRQGQQGAATGGPAVGTVRNGYRFKGGNPNDQSSWEPANQGGPASAPGTFRR